MMRMTRRLVLAAAAATLGLLRVQTTIRPSPVRTMRWR